MTSDIEVSSGLLQETGKDKILHNAHRRSAKLHHVLHKPRKQGFHAPLTPFEQERKCA